MRASVAEQIEIAAPADAVWDYIFDWRRQGEWIPGTRVRVVDGDGHAVGARIEAWTGVGRMGFLDTMTVTRWEPRAVCEVEHTGRVIRGSGTFSVVALAGRRSRFDWSEDLEIPFGRVGYTGFRAARPALRSAVRRALRRLKRTIEA
jgi:carbon monoxide dehydrogenase subunit G